MAAMLASVWLAGRLQPADGGEEAAILLDRPAREETETVCSASAEWIRTRC
jgi:hypothetical protein